MKEKGRGKGAGRVDVRVVSLYSRDIQGLAALRRAEGPNRYGSFAYYDAVDVEAAALPEEALPEGEPALQAAYRKAVGMEGRPGMFRQFLLAVADAAPEGAYSPAGLRAFWEDRRFPLFFMTMFSVREPGKLREALKKVRRRFRGERFRAYLTFDHSDIILFGRGDGFRDYAKRLFRLDYENCSLLADSITIYGFAPGEAVEAENPGTGGAKAPREETFGAYLQAGVRDYGGMEAFWRKILPASGQARRFWLLGRNDMGIFHPAATLSWLRSVKRAAQEGEPWYSTYSLRVLIRPGRVTAERLPPPPADPPPEDLPPARRMREAYAGFAEAYTRRCEALGVTADRVWLRWLRESSALAASLMNSALAWELGVCLAPQFFDLFAYGKKLFEAGMPENAGMEDLKNGFAEFFSNISILIDSMNHSNRQFVQVPSFHSVSFEIPPKLMAYYTAMAHRLVEVFYDDASLYGLTIAPKFVKELEVCSIALPEAVESNEFISMSVGEDSLYTLRLTTETMAHEISHFVGHKGRCREKRKECVIRCAVQKTLADLLALLPGVLRDRRPLPEADAPAVGAEGIVSFGELRRAAEAVWEKLAERVPEYRSGRDAMGVEVRRLVYGLPAVLAGTPELFVESFERTWALASGGGAPDYLARWAAARAGAGPEDAGRGVRERTAAYEGRQLFRELLEEYARAVLALAEESAGEENETPFGPLYKYKRLCDLFRETFADLQAVLLFDMSWEQYRNLLRRGDGWSGLKDCPLRMLAVAGVLAESGRWSAEEVRKDPDAPPGFREAMGLEPQRHAGRLGKLGFDAAALFYLREYLRECGDRVEEVLGEEERRPKVEALRRMHEALSDESSVLELDQALLEFVGGYREDYIRRLPGDGA